MKHTHTHKTCGVLHFSTHTRTYISLYTSISILYLPPYLHIYTSSYYHYISLLENYLCISCTFFLLHFWLRSVCYQTYEDNICLQPINLWDQLNCVMFDILQTKWRSQTSFSALGSGWTPLYTQLSIYETDNYNIYTHSDWVHTLVWDLFPHILPVGRSMSSHLMGPSWFVFFTQTSWSELLSFICFVPWVEPGCLFLLHVLILPFESLAVRPPRQDLILTERQGHPDISTHQQL